MRRSFIRHALSLIVLIFVCTAFVPEGIAQRGRGRGFGGPLVPATQPSPPRNPARHDAFLEVAQDGGIDLLFVGDSITDGWDNAGEQVWNEFFVPLNVANFGIGGDTTQGVLWRMRNGELEGFNAKLIVLMLGTNNINRNPNDEIAAGNHLIVEEFRRHQPQADVLILGIFPRGEEPDNPYRASIAQINSRLADLANDETIFYMDIGPEFLTEDGTLTAEIMPDGLAIIETVHELME